MIAPLRTLLPKQFELRFVRFRRQDGFVRDPNRSGARFDRTQSIELSGKAQQELDKRIHPRVFRFDVRNKLP